MSTLAEMLAAMAYLAKQQLNAVTDNDQRLRASALYPNWKAGKHSVGEIYNADGQTWECYAAYDNAAYPDIIPGSIAWPTFNRPLHGKTPETARPFVAPTHAEDIYYTDEYMTIDTVLYHCKRNTSFGPADDPGAWEVA